MEVSFLAQGKKTKEDVVREAMTSPKKIDTSISFNIPRSHQHFDETKHKFKCSSCGKGFGSQNGNFQKSNSPLFQSNDGYLPWCRDCTDKYFALLTALYSGNQYHAIEHYCQQADWVYDINPLVAARETESGHRDRTILAHYSAKKNLNTGGRKTYIDTIKNDFESKQEEIIQSKDDVKEKELSVTGTAIDRWGIGLTEWDYSVLEDHYKMLKKNNPNIDANQEIFVKSCCNLYWMQTKMLRSDNVDATKYTSLVEQYSKTFKQAGLKTIEEKDNSADECLGVTLATIAQYTPEEYYKNKSIYTDFDGIGDYFDRFVKRPLKNLMFGSNERDKKFCVKDTDIDE